MNGEAVETAFLWIGVTCIVLLWAVTVAACVYAPMQGNWAPDIAVGFWAVLAGIGYGVYRIVKWRQVDG